MRFQKVSAISLILSLALVLGIGCASTALASDTAKTGQPSDWKFHDIVDLAFVQQYAKLPVPEGVMIIDSRPYKPKYAIGHIPTAVSIPHSQFDKMTAKLPADKNALLIFYCQGPTWKLSHKSARKAEKLGYTNVKVFADGFPAWMKAQGSYAAVSIEYVAKQYEANQMIIVDSRPKRAKFDKGHIPSAISIPDTQFDKLKGKLPVDKATPLVFYCGGFTWKLSHKSARKAVKLGYTNVKVFAAGYPAWKAAYGKGTSVAVASAKPAAPTMLKAGKEEGSVDEDTFVKIVKNNPESIMLIDVRDADEFKLGSFKTAINIPVDDLEAKIKTLPADKPIVFVCGTGARSGESYYMVQDVRPALKNVYYLEGTLTFQKDGSFEIKDPVSG
jgi:rhodanese-related sulfurtransferase